MMSNKRIRDNFGYWCAEAIEREPDKVALIDLSRDPAREVTYREFDERMNRVASWTRASGLVPGDRVAMIVSNRFEFIEIMYGLMRAGVVPVPLNIKLGADTLQYIMEDADIRAAFVEPTAHADARRIVDRMDVEMRVVVGDGGVSWFPPGGPPSEWLPYEATLADYSDTFDPPELEPEHPSFQPYTSGSTGRPKGVVLTHSGQLWWVRCLKNYWPEKREDRALAAVPLYHKNAMAGAIKPLFQAGGSVVLLPDFEPRRFLQALCDYRCTQTGAVPAVFTRLLQHQDLIERLDFSPLKSISIGSAPVQEELMEAVKKAFGCAVSESYGLTEGGPVMIGPPLDGRPVPLGSCGVVWPEGDVKLVGENDEKQQHEGELWVRNPGVTPGYFNLPDVNRERLRDGWLATGDLFSRDAGGFFYFKGRCDDMFNCGGENIYPKEVENLLLSHDDVSDAAVVPLPHSVKGFVPVAMVMSTSGGVGDSVDEQTLKEYCLRNGPAYAHPRRIWLVSAMPLNGAGKVDRRQVQDGLEAKFGAEFLSGSAS